MVVALVVAATALATGVISKSDSSAQLARQIDPSKPKNVILLIGDGTDESMITAARNYRLGAAGKFELDKLPFVGDMTTYGVQPGPGPDYAKAYVSDSAATATAWSTGRKTIVGRLSQGPSTGDTVPGKDLRTVAMSWRDRGARTGNVSNVEVTDATPAAVAASVNMRSCQGPQDMAQCASAKKSSGGKGSIAEQLVDNKLDVILGGGLNRYNQPTDAGPSVLSYARSKYRYRHIADSSGLDKVKSLKKGRVLGLFAPANLAPRYAPLIASPPPGAGGPETKCGGVNRGAQPSLSAMTKKAISLLENNKGFFLQVESGLVDKQEHAADICGAIGGVGDLDDAVKVALNFRKNNPDTLIIVTSDHGQSTQIVADNTSGRQTATIKTADGDPMFVAYSTRARGAGHTGTTVRVAAIGPGAASVTGLIDQTDLYELLRARN